MIHFVVLINRQGKARLTKWYDPFTSAEKNRIIREITNIIISRAPKLCNFVEWKKYKLIYKRYASLYFVFGVSKSSNELIVMEQIHHFVESLDLYFGNVTELDLIFNFHKAYFILDELIISGEMQEPSKKLIINLVRQQDDLQDAPYEPEPSTSNTMKKGQFT